MKNERLKICVCFILFCLIDVSYSLLFVSIIVPLSCCFDVHEISLQITFSWVTHPKSCYFNHRQISVDSMQMNFLHILLKTRQKHKFAFGLTVKIKKKSRQCETERIDICSLCKAQALWSVVFSVCLL